MTKALLAVLCCIAVFAGANVTAQVTRESLQGVWQEAAGRVLTMRPLVAKVPRRIPTGQNRSTSAQS